MDDEGVRRTVTQLQQAVAALGEKALDLKTGSDAFVSERERLAEANALLSTEIASLRAEADRARADEQRAKDELERLRGEAKGAIEDFVNGSIDKELLKSKLDPFAQQTTLFVQINNLRIYTIVWKLFRWNDPMQAQRPRSAAVDSGRRTHSVWRSCWLSCLFLFPGRLSEFMVFSALRPLDVNDDSWILQLRSAAEPESLARRLMFGLSGSTAAAAARSIQCCSIAC